MPSARWVSATTSNRQDASITSIRPRSSPLVERLEDVFGPGRCLFGVLTRVTPGPALPQEIPALVERDLDGPKTFGFGRGEGLTGMSALQRVFLFGELADVTHDFLIVHPSLLPQPAKFARVAHPYGLRLHLSDVAVIQVSGRHRDMNGSE